MIYGNLFTPRASLPEKKLRDAIPTDIPGWTSRDLSIAETVELQKAVASTLQFDDMLTRGYTNGRHDLTVYVAYWRPGKVPPRSVGVHTPDTCWIQNGWIRRGRDYSVPLTADIGPLKPAERGIYEFNGLVLYVLFWHLVGGEPYAYQQEGLHSLTAPLKDLFTFGLRQRHDQLFVRLASNEPFEQIWRDPGLQSLLSALGKLGLAKPLTAAR